MATTYLVSTALMGVLVIAVVTWMVRGHGWYQYSPRASTSSQSPASDRESRFEAYADQPLVWVAGFAVLAVGLLIGVVASISGPVETQATAGLVVAVVGGAGLCGYLLFGVYLSATRRGHPRSLAVAESATVAGVLFLIAIGFQLVA
ncbi:hypothetical protein SAMN05443574_102157 [Haloarcula vallismortis]|uniref:Uncharacterized protein n=2 Tax=Haloarcula vallismortis TaxID=28442 RepID=M0JPL3_HALVA|nr:hypothetical protein [Haloarcula vallismortis]EMA10941.1 hypothetical protein C437_02877 [Haloarcula vallismortis ATCC 29715]SDW25726.1 hypothetical protein SAMN05443574_102157 [Haloarcula vallismortis]